MLVSLSLSLFVVIIRFIRKQVKNVEGKYRRYGARLVFFRNKHLGETVEKSSFNSFPRLIGEIHFFPPNLTFNLIVILYLLYELIVSDY